MRPLVQRPPLDGLIATLGVALFLALLEQEIFGTATQFAPSPVGEWRVVVLRRHPHRRADRGPRAGGRRSPGRSTSSSPAPSSGSPSSPRPATRPWRASSASRSTRCTASSWVTAGALSGLAAALLGPAFGGLTPFDMTKFALRALGRRGDRRPRLGLGRDHRQPADRRARGGRRGAGGREGRGRTSPCCVAGHRHARDPAAGPARDVRCCVSMRPSRRRRSRRDRRSWSPGRAPCRPCGCRSWWAWPWSRSPRSASTSSWLGRASSRSPTPRSSASAPSPRSTSAATAGRGRSRSRPRSVPARSRPRVAGLPSLRIRGLQVAITTLAFQVAAENFLFTRQDFTAADQVLERPGLPASPTCGSISSRSRASPSCSSCADGSR